jgi:methyl-accepting chemotaxis protein
MMGKASLKLKLTLGFGSVLLILVTDSVVDYFSIQEISRFSTAADAKADEAYLTHTVEARVNSRRIEIRSFLLTGNEEYMNKYQEQDRALSNDLASLEPLLTTETSKSLFARLKQAENAYDRDALHAAALKRAHQMQAATELLFGSEMSAERDEIESVLAELVQRTQDVKNSTRQQQTKVEARAGRETIVLGLIGLMVGLVATALIPRHLTIHIRKMLTLIDEIAAKNLAMEDIDVSSPDEVGKASAALNTMKNNLRELINSIARTAEHVASASEQISSSAQQQAQSADTQKGQAAQVAAAMQEMSSAVNEVSENSNRAAEASRQAAETAREGGVIVEESLGTMRAIAESVSATAHKVEDLGKSSDQIGRIIGVIDDIADQTNLLALNAAIEAARAGEQGRGFAVVADEVRKLAERTTSATKEVAHMVESIQSGTKNAVAAMHEGTRQVQEGVQTTSRAGDALKQIIHTSEQVGEMVNHIATAAAEQSSATVQVNQNVDHIARLVSETAIGSQQSARACQDLSGLALDLQKMVSSFRLETIAGAAQKRASGSNSDRKAFAAGA